MSNWVSRTPCSGSELDAGAMKLIVTDQRDRGCGWVWHVTVEHAYGSDAIGQEGGLASEDQAKEAATAWARGYCENVLAALAPVVEAPTRGGPTEQFPDAPYCKPDQSCCDFCCGN